MNFNTRTPRHASRNKPAPTVIVEVPILNADCEKYGIEKTSPNRKRIRRGYAIFESAFTVRPHIHRNGPNDNGSPTFTVFSQNPDLIGKEKYTVTLDPSQPHGATCTCPDITQPPQAQLCKHSVAALMLDEYDRDMDTIARMEALYDHAETGPEGHGCDRHDHANGFGF